MVVSLNNRRRIKRRKAPPTKKNATTGPNKRMPAPVRQRRGHYADTTAGRMSNNDGGMALLNTARVRENERPYTTNRKKTISNLEMRLGKAEATLRHKLDGHRVERDGDIGMGTNKGSKVQHLVNIRNFQKISNVILEAISKH